MGYFNIPSWYNSISYSFSIPFMGYLNGILKLDGEFNNFQFPLWDTRSILLDAWERSFKFSIPFMGYWLLENKPELAYNFQFPLWDTVC